MQHNVNAAPADLALSGYGAYVALTPLTPKAGWCLAALLDTTPIQWQGRSLVVEAKCLPDILDALVPWCTVKGIG